MHWRAPNWEQSFGKHQRGTSSRSVDEFLLRCFCMPWWGASNVWALTALLQCTSENYTNIRFCITHIRINRVETWLWSCRCQQTQRNLCKLCIVADEPLQNSRTKIFVKNYANIRHHTWKNKYRRDLIMILQISADAKEFMQSEHRCWLGILPR